MRERGNVCNVGRTCVTDWVDYGDTCDAGKDEGDNGFVMVQRRARRTLDAALCGPVESSGLEP